MPDAKQTPCPRPQAALPKSQVGWAYLSPQHRHIVHVHLSHARRHTATIIHPVLEHRRTTAPSSCLATVQEAPAHAGTRRGLFSEGLSLAHRSQAAILQGHTKRPLFRGERATKHLQLAQGDESPPVLTSRPRPPPQFLPIHPKQRRPSPRHPRCHRCPHHSPRPEPASGGVTSAWTPGARPRHPPASSSWPEGSSASWEEADPSRATLSTPPRGPPSRPSPSASPVLEVPLCSSSPSLS